MDSASTCDQFCARYRTNYTFIFLCGIASLVVYRCVDRFSIPNSTYVLNTLELIDTTVLPRSFFDLRAVSANRTAGYLLATELMMTSAAFIGVFNIVRQVSDFKNTFPLGVDFSKMKYLIGCVIGVVACLLFHPPSLAFTSIKDNYLDDVGFYFLRESLLISMGYYYLSVLIINIVNYYKIVGLRRRLTM